MRLLITMELEKDFIPPGAVAFMSSTLNTIAVENGANVLFRRVVRYQPGNSGFTSGPNTGTGRRQENSGTGKGPGGPKGGKW